MQNYINQLIADLEEVAQNPPSASFIEIPPYFAGDPADAELALAPYKTIEEWTGVKQEVFPEIIQLQGGQWSQVNKAIFKVFESLKLELVDAPSEMPPELLYEVLTTNWHHQVQYLPSSGMDLELCTGDAMTCPYGEYCSCGEEFDDYEIPPRFNDVLPKIAGLIDAGFICYLNPITLEIEDIPEMLIEDSDEFEMITDFGPKDEKLKHDDWDQFYTFTPLESFESFKIMEAFADSLEEDKIKEQLYQALNHQKPFANFKWKIDNSPYRQDWFDFKQKWLENHVKEIIWSEVNRITNDFPEEINGFYDDDGTKIDPESVPVPSLCIICKSHMADDWEENMLCLMNRYDQRNDSDFKCGMFEKL